MTLHLTELLEKEVARVTTKSYNIQSIEHTAYVTKQRRIYEYDEARDERH